MHEPDTVGERVADAVATAMGSWRFIISQTIFVILWMSLNIVGVTQHWDAYPFILLNLLFSTQAAYAAPIIMMSQNRQASKDRKRDDQEAIEVHLLYTINQQQLAILQQQQQEIVLLRSLLDVARTEHDPSIVGAAASPLSDDHPIQAAEEHADDAIVPTPPAPDPSVDAAGNC